MSTVFNFDFIKSKIKTISKITKAVLDKIERSQRGTFRTIPNLNT